MFRNLGCHIIEFPSKKFGYVGSIPTVLGEQIPASTSAVLGCRSFPGEDGQPMEWRFPAFETQDEAIAFAKSKGVTVLVDNVPA